MNFDSLFNQVFDEATKYGNKFGNWKDYDKRFYPDVAPQQAASAVTSVIGTDPTGPIIDVNRFVYAKKLNQVIETASFVDEYTRGPVESKNLLREKINKWKAGGTIMRIDSPKHTLSGLIWDVSHVHPSIKVRLAIDGRTRTLSFLNVWWSYNEYENQFTA